MADQFYCFYAGDYHRDTGDLSLLEHGVYRTLLDHYYMQGGLTADTERLYRLCRAFTDEERIAVENMVKRFFISKNGKLSNRRADEEIAKRKAFIEGARIKGRAGASARWNRTKNESDAWGNAQAMPKQCLNDGIPSPSPSPNKNKNKKTYCPNSVEFRLSELLLGLIKNRKSDFKNPDLQKWAVHIDRMIRIDKREPERIRAVIEWCQGDDFWMNNILSSEKLRLQFDKLELKMVKDGEIKSKSQKPHGIPWDVWNEMQRSGITGSNT